MFASEFWTSRASSSSITADSHLSSLFTANYLFRFHLSEIPRLIHQNLFHRITRFGVYVLMTSTWISPGFCVTRLWKHVDERHYKRPCYRLQYALRWQQPGIVWFWWTFEPLLERPGSTTTAIPSSESGQLGLLRLLYVSTLDPSEHVTFESRVCSTNTVL